MSTVKEALMWASLYMSARGIEQPRFEAELLLVHATGWTRLQVLLDNHRPLTRRQMRCFTAAVKKRSRGMPLAYITGEKEFYGLPFKVCPGVLIPRPETELIVERVLSWADAAGCPDGEGLTAVDLGTGSGNLAVILARLLPAAAWWAVDRSARALRVAQANAARHGVAGRITWRKGDFFKAFDAGRIRPRFNLVVANPPYIAEDDFARLPREIKEYEPRPALLAGKDGLASYRRILAQLPRHMLAPGAVFMEIGAGQSTAVADLCRKTGLFRSLTFHQDLQGWPRVLEGLF